MNLTPQYSAQFSEIAQLIQQSRVRAIRGVNHELIELYWHIGCYISQKVAASEWGKSVVVELARYLASHEVNVKGFSDKNLWRMKQFYETYRHSPKLSALLREISWTQNLTIFSRCKTEPEREFYLKLTHQEQYTSRELERQISASLFERTLLGQQTYSPALQQRMADNLHLFKDSYVFDFLALSESHSENDLQIALVQQIKNFILELGKDFLFMGQEYKVQVGYTDFYIDLLFYHRELQCLVAFELKTTKFKPEHLGQLNFYLEALDRDVKKPQENPSIGILLCKDKDNEVVEYALSRTLSPTMVAEYQIKLPSKVLLQQKLHELFEDI